MLSQACVFVYSSHGKWVFSPLLWSFPPITTFTSFPTPDCWVCAAAPAGWLVFVYSSRGKWVFPSSCGVFLPLPLSQAFPLLVASTRPCSRPLQPGLACLFTVAGGIPLPPLRCSGHPTLFAMCLYCSYCLLLSFSFFPWVGVGLSRGLC
jgi:hypothetical protein